MRVLLPFFPLLSMIFADFDVFVDKLVTVLLAPLPDQRYFAHDERAAELERAARDALTVAGICRSVFFY